ncbi:MAG TPA: hypothetical protein ENL20_02245 [Candidatus Cloacimonetes bacterium]|nr:hypothetical protein [Candidatus Cloacimonadota bacterium]
MPANLKQLKSIKGTVPMINIKLNGKEIQTEAGKTILQVSNEHGIEIPTLCHDKELKPFGSCWLCAVKVEGRRGFVTACGTDILDGMEITTDSQEIRKARKMALELLLSDHYADCEAPCKIACPDKVDVQTYVSLIANGQHHEAVKVIKENLPMPLSIGRVCPAFCEAECRRTIVDEPIAIRQLKRYAADFDLFDDWSYIPEKAPIKNKKIAIVGGGPSGLTCGYYLSNNGYNVTVFESAPKAGGWLRYGIPEYRLPKKILNKEIKLMCVNGMKIKTNVEIGKDISLSNLSKKYDAVYLGIGAQKAVPMRVKNSELKGCFLGVDFLKDFILGKKIKLGEKVAIIGGGNTAIDCARTSKRMGSDVTLIYRRTRKEMPAEAYEVDAAEEEGIKFHFLTNPVENIGKNGVLKTIKLEKMKLGEPDQSGRRRPVPTGEFFNEDFDSIIAAISQSPDVDFLTEDANKIDGKEIPLTRWSTCETPDETMYSGIANIFAGGDFRRGPATAIEAIADGRIAANAIDRFLQGKLNKKTLQLFNSRKEKKLKDVDPNEFKQYEKIPRFKMPELDPEIRCTNHKEVELGFEEEDARAEADRCLECGCQDNTTCALRKYATDYEIDADLFMGDKNKHPIDHTHPFILRDANRCIKCGRCVRICSEVQGPGVLGYIFRGFVSYVAPEFGESLTKTTCESCGKCIEVCPVGALVSKNQNYKLNPHVVEKITQNCGLCGTGCKIDVNVQTDKVTVIQPAAEADFNDRNLCFAGKFGWQILEDKERIIIPYKKVDSTWEKIDDCWEEFGKCMEFHNLIQDNLAKAKTRKIYVSAMCSNEEILLMKDIADTIGADISSLSYEESFVDDIKLDKTYRDLEQAEAIVIIGKISHTLKILARTQQRKGKKLILITDEEKEFNKFADEQFNDSGIENTLEKIIACYYNDDDLDEDCDIHEKIDELKPPAKTLFIYNSDDLTEKSIWNIWMLSSFICDFSSGSGVLPTSNFSNMRGLREFGIKAGKPEISDFVIVYGEHLNEIQRKTIEQSKFIISIKTHLEANEISDIIIPQTSYLEMEGTAIANDGRITTYKNPKNSHLFENLLATFKNIGLLNEKKVKNEFWKKQVIKALKKENKKKIVEKENLIDYLNSIEKIKIESHKHYSLQNNLIAKLKLATKE